MDVPEDLSSSAKQEIEHLKSVLENFSFKLEHVKREIDLACDLHALYQVRLKYLGRKGELPQFFATLRRLPKDRKLQFSKTLNRLKKALTVAFDERKLWLTKEELHKKSQILDSFDPTLPGRFRPRGSLHPITLGLRKIEDFFLRLGFVIKEGPEVEDEFHNFEALNIPSDHPARAMHDTFFLENQKLLRTHTSPVQVRTMLACQPPSPLKIIAPGKVYRRDYDPTHSPMFHQVEGLVVAETVSFADLIFVVKGFLRDFFVDEKLKMRLRPSYFPFTEPSAEVDIWWGSDWLEVLGCGMVHPNVFKAVGYDEQRWSGYAFGLGVERLVMLRHGVKNLRRFFENDLRFLNQFKE